MRQQRMENPESRSRFQVTVHGMFASDHDTEKASGKKYQRDSQRGRIIGGDENSYSKLWRCAKVYYNFFYLFLEKLYMYPTCLYAILKGI